MLSFHPLLYAALHETRSDLRSQLFLKYGRKRSLYFSVNAAKDGRPIESCLPNSLHI